MGICQSAKQNNINSKNNNLSNNNSKNYPLTDRTNKNRHHSIILNNDILISKNESNPDLIYKKIKIIGKGSFGEVWLVKNRELNKQFAMKIIKNNKNKPKINEEIINEIEILKTLDHPKVVKVLDFYVNEDNFYIITEYCPEGELFNEIIKKGKFDEGQSSFIMNQLFKAMAYCHGMNIIHRDLKPENIMITQREKNECLQVKIIDFGTAKIFEKGRSENRYVGSSYYMAPEVIQRHYNEKCDIWSCGVILYILLTGRPPFDGDEDKDIIKSIKEGVYDTKTYPYPNLSKEAQDLISKCLQYDPNKRLTAQQCLEHKWFKTKTFINKDKINQIAPELAEQILNNMKNYNVNNILRCTVIAYLVHNNSSIEQCLEASKLFSKIDINNDGKIEKHELVKGFEDYWKISHANAENEVEDIFNNIDTDHNGYIEYEEFLRAAVDPNVFTSRNYLKFAFKYFDKDDSGYITLDELKKKFMQTVDNKNNTVEKEIEKIFYSIDINKDGSISFEEFCKMMKNIIKN